jgi:cyclic 2,3-diphosphoglycerate synthase
MQDLDEADGYDVLLTELKAAAVDVACERAIERGAEVVFVDNRATVVEGDMDLDTMLGSVVGVAMQRGRDRE